MPTIIQPEKAKLARVQKYTACLVDIVVEPESTYESANT